MTEISVWAEEKIGLPSYSNVVIGSRVTKTYADDVDEATALREVAEIVETFLAEERAGVLELVQNK